MIFSADPLLASWQTLSPDTLVVGIDEVGRGPLLGDVVAAAVMVPLAVQWVSAECESVSHESVSHESVPHESVSHESVPHEHAWHEIVDSKQCSPAKRQQLATWIMQAATAVGFGHATAAEIDQYNILQASLLAMQRAYHAMLTQIQAAQQPDFIVVDGRQLPTLPALPPHCQLLPIIKADQAIRAVAAASIVAKVRRDYCMVALDQLYPGYGIAQHKGYPTKAHRQALRRLGPIPQQHRRSFAPVRALLSPCSRSAESHLV